MRKLSIKETCLLLGYDLWMNKLDVMGVKHLYKTAPLSGNGGINYFDSITELENWTIRVMNDRKLFYDNTTLAELMLVRSKQLS